MKLDSVQGIVLNSPIVYTGINGKDRYKFELVARQLN
jgi:hypothetical protein